MEISLSAAIIGALGVTLAGLLAFLASWQRDYLSRLKNCEDRLTTVEKENAGLRSEKLVLEEALARRDRKIERLTERIEELERHIARLESERRDADRREEIRDARDGGGRDHPNA